VIESIKKLLYSKITVQWTALFPLISMAVILWLSRRLVCNSRHSQATLGAWVPALLIGL